MAQSRLAISCEFRYNTRAMKLPLHRIYAAVLLGLGAFAADAAVRSEQAPPTVTPGRELLVVTNDLWFLLSGVSDKEDADAAAPRFDQLVKKAATLGDSLFAASSDGQDVEALAALPYENFIEAYNDLYHEFEVLCQSRCFGSENLINSFRKAVELGVFSDENMADLEQPKPPLTEKEARHELVRYKRLVEPDRAVLEILQGVQDAGSADKAAAELVCMTARLEQLKPESDVAYRKFGDVDQPTYRATYASIHPLLWGIRNEIVRIAGIPGYDQASFDAFSDALDSVFENLGVTHSAWFDEVFDASFLLDLDDALRENATTSK